MYSKERPKVTELTISPDGLEELFQQPEIAAKYKSVRESEEVEKSYRYMMEAVIQSTEDEITKETLNREYWKEFSEELLKAVTVIDAFEKLLKEGKGDIQSSVLEVITVDNMIDNINSMRTAAKDCIQIIQKYQFG